MIVFECLSQPKKKVGVVFEKRTFLKCPKMKNLDGLFEKH